MNLWTSGHEAERDAYLSTNPLAGNGWFPTRRGVAGMGLFERVDDYSAAAFVYLTECQPASPVDVAAATADLTRREFERPDPLEAFL